MKRKPFGNSMRPTRDSIFEYSYTNKTGSGIANGFLFRKSYYTGWYRTCWCFESLERISTDRDRGMVSVRYLYHLKCHERDRGIDITVDENLEERKQNDFDPISICTTIL